MWESFLNPTSIFLENRESTIEIARPNKEINVFGVSRETGINTDHVSAAEQEWYFILPKQLDRALVKRSTLAVAGVCGFGGGFGRRMLNAWGESLIKQFVQEAIDYAVRLEQALSKLQTEKKIVVLHYSPIRATVQGEDPEIFAFLGSSRLEEPINRFRVNAVFHGHAHNGTADATTGAGVPVYNVSAPLLRRAAPDQAPFRIVEF